MTRPFGVRDKVGYALGDAANDVTYVLVSAFFLLYATNVAGVDPVHTGTVLAAVRLAEAFAGFAVGRFLDVRTPPRGDRFRPWLPRLTPVVSAAVVLAFLPAVAGWEYPARLAWVAASYLLFALAHSSLGIAYGALAGTVSPEPAHRSALSVARTVGGLPMTLLVAVLVPLAVFRATDRTLDPGRLWAVAIACGVVGLLGHLACAGLVRERVAAPPRPAGAALGATLRAFGRDRALLALVAATLLLLLALGLPQALSVYLWLEYFGEPRMQGAAALAMAVPLLLGVPVAGRLAARFGKKELSVAALGVSGAATIALGLLRTTEPVAFLAFLPVVALGQATLGLLVWACLADVADGQELAGGVRDDATVYAVYLWSRKLGQAVAVGLSGWVLGAVGYRPATGGADVQQSDATLTGLYLACTVVPGALLLVVATVIAWGYPLTRDRVRANSAELVARAAERDVSPPGVP